MKLRITIKSLFHSVLPGGEIDVVKEVKMVLEGKVKISGPIDEVRKLLLQTELNANADGSRHMWIEEL